MKMRLLMQWDIRPGLENQYQQFVVGEFAPAAADLGLEIVEYWYTIYGNRPKIMVAGVIRDEQTRRRMIASQEWQELFDRLFKYVQNFQKKMIPDQGSFQL